jgi:lipoprotein
MKGGKAIVLAFITAISCTAGIYGQRVYIAPIVSVDEGEESYGIDERFREDIYASIEEQK